MKLTPPSYLLLGMLRLGVRSGYAIKRSADRSTRNFWPMSLAKVYPELARLEQAGLVTGRDDPQGSRARRSYELTTAGERALVNWLRAPRYAQPQVRDERLLRLFFADALPRDEQIALLRRQRESDEAEVARIREEIIPLTHAAEESGTMFPSVVARLIIEILSSAAKWLEELEAELSADRNSQSHDQHSGAIE
jgi:DNA-binding PadR family transcriptional regulator